MKFGSATFIHLWEDGERETKNRERCASLASHPCPAPSVCWDLLRFGWAREGVRCL